MIKNLRAIPVDLLYNVIRLDLTNFRSGIRNLKKNPIEWKGGVEMKLLESGKITWKRFWFCRNKKKRSGRLISQTL